MPPSWKKSGRIARLISGLRSNRAAASSLSVETGFPTSLADLLVKNHSRLKTKAATAAAVQAASRSPSPPTPPNPASALALTPPKSASAPALTPADTPAVQNPASAPALTPPKRASAPADPPTVQRAPVVRLGSGFLAAATAAATQAASRSPSAPADPPAAQRAPAVRLGFSFLVAEVMALVLLAIGEKQLVFRITVVAFVLMVLDLVGFRVFELLMPCEEARRGIDRELEAAVSRSGSEGSVSGELVEMREDGAVQKVPRKKSWKRLVPKRLRSKRSAKDSVDELDSGSFGRRVSNCGSEEMGLEEEEQREVEARNAEICVVQSVEGNACECRSVSSRRLLLFVVLLFGLAGGRVAALAVTVAWFMLTNSIDTLWRKARVHRVC